MKIRKYLIYLIIPFFTGCAINYKPMSFSPLVNVQKEGVGLSASFPEIIKKKDDSLFNNSRLQQQLKRNGYKTYKLSITNYTKERILIDAKHLYAIKEHQVIPYLHPEDFLKTINFNRGLFLSISGYGLISPFAYAGRKVSFGKSRLIMAVPIFAYGAANAIIAYRSIKNLRADIKEHYIVGKTILPSQTVSGFVIVKTGDDDFGFVYKTVP